MESFSILPYSVNLAYSIFHLAFINSFYFYGIGIGSINNVTLQSINENSHSPSNR
ncbi:MAG: hypothetical protein WDA22_06120 [Bacteroidota bacterium]